MLIARGECEYDRAGIPGSTVPGGRRHCANHEDKEDTYTYTPHIRAL